MKFRDSRCPFLRDINTLLAGFEIKKQQILSVYRFNKIKYPIIAIQYSKHNQQSFCIFENKNFKKKKFKFILKFIVLIIFQFLN